MRKAITFEERLRVILGFLTTGHTFSWFQDPPYYSTVIEVCGAFFECLRGEYHKLPSTKEEFYGEYRGENKRTVAISQLSWCGRCQANCTPTSEKLWIKIHIYKVFFSTVLMAIVDYDYKFLFWDVGCQGRISGEFSKALEKGTLNLSEATDDPDKAITITFATIALHNMFHTKDREV